MKHYACVTAFLFLFILSCAGSAISAEGVFRPIQTSLDDMELIDVGTVTEIMKADMIKFDTGRRYYLDSVRIPPFSSIEVKDYLEKTLLGKKVGIYYNKRLSTGREDKNGNFFGQMQTEDGVWVQGDLVSKGMAWVKGSTEKRDLLLPLLKTERTARENKIGIWKDKEFSIRNINNIHAYLNTFQIFEGTVTSALVTGDPKVVEFAFTEAQMQNPSLVGVVVPNAMKTFQLTVLQDVNFASFNNVRIRIRGWVKQGSKSPIIEIHNPEEIEFPDYEKYDREMLMKTVQPPPIMPYDVKVMPKK